VKTYVQKGLYHENSSKGVKGLGTSGNGGEGGASRTRCWKISGGSGRGGGERAGSK